MRISYEWLSLCEDFLLVSEVASRSTVRPCRITVTASEIAITSSSLCVMSTIVPPSARNRRSTCHSSATSSSPARGGLTRWTG